MHVDQLVCISILIWFNQSSKVAWIINAEMLRMKSHVSLKVNYYMYLNKPLDAPSPNWFSSHPLPLMSKVRSLCPQFDRFLWLFILPHLLSWCLNCSCCSRNFPRRRGRCGRGDAHGACGRNSTEELAGLCSFLQSGRGLYKKVRIIVQTSQVVGLWKSGNWCLNDP